MKKLLILLVLGLLSCSKVECELEYEKKVMNDIFIEVIDAIYSEPELLPPPPPPPPEIYFSTKNQNVKDSIVNHISIVHNEYVLKFKKRASEIRSNSNKISIAVVDTLRRVEKMYENLLIENFPNENLIIRAENNQVEYLIDLNEFNKSNKYQFKYYSGSTDDFNIWNDNYLSQPRSIVSFSRIQFDTTKKYGIFSGRIAYSRHSGHGFYVLLIKENKVWKIEKIIDTWIS